MGATAEAVVGVVIVLVAIAIFYKYIWPYRSTEYGVSEHEQDQYVSYSEETEEVIEDEADPEILEAIHLAENADDLMNVVEEYGEFVGRENDAILGKVRAFGACLDDHDWILIYEASEEGSELQSMALNALKI